MNKNMQIFLEFVEIRTKIASLFPMLIGFLWTILYFKQFNLWNSIVFFFAATIFDMTVTAINNTMDYKKAVDEEYKHEENVIGKHNLDFKTMVMIIFILLSISLALSIYLVVLTDITLLAIGGGMYFIGIIYTFGPLPISRTPYGEIFSSLTMGFGITFLSVYMSLYESLFSSTWQGETVTLTIGWLDMIMIFWFALPLIFLIANIMLANNTRDLDKDQLNHRWTLVHYIGRPRAIQLYQVLSIAPWIIFISYIISGVLPWWALIALVGIYKHYQSVERYKERIPSPIAFKEAIQSFVLFSSIYVSVLVVALVF